MKHVPLVHGTGTDAHALRASHIHKNTNFFNYYMLLVHEAQPSRPWHGH